MNHCRIPSEDRRLYRWMPGVGETATERDLNDIFEVKLNLIGCQRIGESIERRLQPGFKIFEDVYDFLNSRLVDHTARSIDEQTNVFMKLNVSRTFHYRILGQAFILWKRSVRSKCRQRGRPEQ